jgi:RNA polymerase sigma factor (sigma-70 family)
MPANVTNTSTRTSAAAPLTRRPREPRRVPTNTLDAAVRVEPSPDWPALAAAFREGDRAAAEVVAVHLAPYVLRLVRRLTAWQNDADDLVQDVLVEALAARTKFRGEAKLETWITRIAINRVRAHGRKQWLRRRLFAAWAGRQPDNTAPPADVATQTHEQSQAIRDAVARLPTKSREAIVLHYLQGLTPAEAAAALGVSVGAIEVRLSRARDKLRALLTKPNPAEALKKSEVP